MVEEHNLSETEKLIASDKVLKDAFNTLLPELRFHNIIASFFEGLNIDASQKIVEVRAKKYTNVQNSISQLWENTRKNSDFLQYTKDFEPLLSELNLRDHFNHSFDVFLLGYFIINKIDELFPKKNYFKANEANRNLIWLLSSTFHDVAYAVEKTDEWLNKFFEKFLGINPHFSINLSGALTPVYTDFIRMLSQQHKNPSAPSFDYKFDSLDWSYYNTLCEELSKKNHGVLSALMLCHRMAIREGFLSKSPKNKGQTVKSGDEWDFLYYHLRASHAISLHHMKTIKVDFHRHPFAYILILCDELQDWGRGNADEQKENIYLKRVVVQTGNRPRVFFEICPYEKTTELIKILSSRLNVDSEIELSINGRDVHETI